MKKRKGKSELGHHSDQQLEPERLKVYNKVAQRFCSSNTVVYEGCESQQLLDPKRDQFHLECFERTCGPTRVEIHFLAMENQLIKLPMAQLVFEAVENCLEEIQGFGPLWSHRTRSQTAKALTGNLFWEVTGQQLLEQY